MERENLPTTYREQIVNHIVQHTSGAVNRPAAAFNADPFTGGSAYVPGTNGFASAMERPLHGADPFHWRAPACCSTTCGSSLGLGERGGGTLLYLYVRRM